MTLQGNFHPREPVSNLFAFVREHALPSAAQKLVLYVGPPRRCVCVRAGHTCTSVSRTIVL